LVRRGHDLLRTAADATAERREGRFCAEDDDLMTVRDVALHVALFEQRRDGSEHEGSAKGKEKQ
jgi:hypothetical protein